jgi:glycosyltransferase involved in cell wall biosynthesis
MREGVAALLSQTVLPHQVVIVIDHSPELLEECRHELGASVEVIASTEPQGLCGARNSGVEASTGEVVAFLDDDAVPARDWVEQLGLAYRDPTAMGAGGTIEPRWVESPPRWFPREYDWVIGCTHSGMPHQPTPVRNLVGANMSFRRSVLVDLGGFRDQLGRVGANAAGAEETDLCIRAHQRWPERTILYEPAATVEHVVPPARGRLDYFRRRCLGEGRSKAILSGLVGNEDGLEAERAYVRRTLPLGFFRGLGDGLRGDAGGPQRAAAIIYGLLVTTYGYATGLRARRPVAAVTELQLGPLRVLTVTPRSPLHQGGVERHVREVTSRLAAAGEEVEVLCAEPGGPPLREQVVDGVPVRAVRAWPANRDYYFAPRLWREMARRPWDVIHVQSYHTLVAPLAMLRALTLRTPYVVTFHGGGHSSGLRNRSRRIQRLLLGPLLRRAARLIAVAHFEIDVYGKDLGLPAERFALIPNGTEPTFSAVASTPRNGAPTLATIGRLERYKGHHRVIEAFPEVLAAQPEARLLVVGSGPYEAELRQLAKELGVTAAVEFTSVPTGDAEAMSALLGRVSLVVLMSEFETHPLVALESAAAGCRLLVAYASGLAELVDQGVARGVPLDERPAALAAAALEELAKPPPVALPGLSSWDECAERLADLYREVAGRGVSSAAGSQPCTSR